MRTNKTKLGNNRNNVAIFCLLKIFFVHSARNFQKALVKNAKIGYNKMIIYVLMRKIMANNEISRIIRHSAARVIEMNEHYTVVEKTGPTDIILNLYDEFKAQQCMLQFVKSGRVAVTRASQDTLGEQLFDEDYKRKSVNKNK